MKQTFFIVGPTATGKSEFAAEIAQRLNAEIVNADAFQIYRGLDLLTAKPDAATLAKAPHHLLSTVPLSEEMNVEKFRTAAVESIQDIHARGKHAIVAGGSGLYLKALTHGLSELPKANRELREELAEATVEELFARLQKLDPEGAKQIDRRNKRRLVRAVEVCVLTGKPFSSQRTKWGDASSFPKGVFVFRERAELYERIDRRVEKMFADGVGEEVRALRGVGATAEKALGLREIRALLAGGISEAECISKIQQDTRRYAKRQLTWFQRQDNFESLNLSSHGFQEAIELIAQTPNAFGVAQMDD
ncbi:MAG: tRNA (adenosine(37)-N6)-dimethylallyltransferase MiaA [Verrucomicrobiota bacterium]|nr:tRNA (adenosine(37)-N6)-dimethylallyltransferase MiaA [Verrucomicrobiota bacterium]